MTVYSLDEHRFAVNEELSALDFNLTETYVLRNSLNNFVPILKNCIEFVEVWSFSRPLQRILHSEVCLSLTTCNCCSLLCHSLTCLILKSHDNSLAISSLCINFNCKGTVLVILVKVWSNEEVTDVALRTCIKVALASDTAKAPKVLVFKITTVTPTHNLHCYKVFLAWFNKLSHVKFSSHLSILTVTNVLTVNIYSDVTCCRTYVHIDLIALPICRNTECLTIRSHMVVLVLNEWRVCGPIMTPCVLIVHIDSLTVSVHFPVSWYRHCTPL